MSSSMAFWLYGLSNKLKGILFLSLVGTVLFTIWQYRLPSPDDLVTINEYLIGLFARGSQLVLVFYIADYFKYTISRNKEND